MKFRIAVFAVLCILAMPVWAVCQWGNTSETLQKQVAEFLLSQGVRDGAPLNDLVSLLPYLAPETLQRQVAEFLLSRGVRDGAPLDDLASLLPYLAPEGQGAYALSEGSKPTTQPLCQWKEDLGNYTGNPYYCYCNGKLHGLWMLHFASGQVHQGTYVDGKQHGQWTIRYADGYSGGGEYVDDKKQGKWKERNADGDEYEGPYVDDKRHGWWTVRLANGKRKPVNYIHGEEQE